MIDWRKIETVLLDLDGTLLDLHFDNYFWLEHVPQRFADANELATEQAKQHLMPKYRAVEGTMQWYCVDYWTRELGLDIAGLKREIKHLIRVHPSVERFLQSLHHLNKQVMLVTNAHSKSLDLKMQHTGLAGYFDHIICTHDFGKPKEDQQFWLEFHEKYPFQLHATLFIDDSLPVLRSAEKFGIRYLLAVTQPDSKKPHNTHSEFEAIAGFDQIMP